MKKKNYDIKVLDSEKEIKEVLSNITDKGTNILFSKTLINLKLGNKSFNIPYDTGFVSNKNELLAILNEKDQDTLRKALDKKSIKYHEVMFKEETFEYQPPQRNKKIVFVRGIESLKETLKDSKKHGKKECIYYPRLRGKLNLKYYLKDDSKEDLISKEIKGLIEFEDKIVLCVKQDENRNVGYVKALRLFDDLNMIVSIKEDTNYDSIRKAKEFIKR